jgi:hypothetical protein
MNDKIKYEGVVFNKRYGKFKSSITYKRITYECGSSDDPREAARLRDITILRLGAPKKLQVLKPKEQ